MKCTPVGTLAQLACILEVSAPKPGNVHREKHFDDATYLDFLLSAAAINGPLDRASETGVGPAVLGAVEATRRIVTTNTNLGMILLLAPLAAVPRVQSLGDGVLTVLRGTTLEDARLVYRAIRLARPGGIGQAPEQDLDDEPTITLVEAMRLAADRDLVARQYANGFKEVLGLALPALREGLIAGLGLESAILSCYLNLLAAEPDTLIARKRGPDVAAEATQRAGQVLNAGWPGTATGRAELEDFDHWLRADGHARNPGTTADVVCAALFVALRDGTIPLPLAISPRTSLGKGGAEGRA